jgi:hypothetical protein
VKLTPSNTKVLDGIPHYMVKLLLWYTCVWISTLSHLNIYHQIIFLVLARGGRIQRKQRVISLLGLQQGRSFKNMTILIRITANFVLIFMQTLKMKLKYRVRK